MDLVVIDMQQGLTCTSNLGRDEFPYLGNFLQAVSADLHMILNRAPIAALRMAPDAVEKRQAPVGIGMLPDPGAYCSVKLVYLVPDDIPFSLRNRAVACAK